MAYSRMDGEHLKQNHCMPSTFETTCQRLFKTTKAICYMSKCSCLISMQTCSPKMMVQ